MRIKVEPSRFENHDRTELLKFYFLFLFFIFYFLFFFEE